MFLSWRIRCRKSPYVVTLSTGSSVFLLEVKGFSANCGSFCIGRPWGPDTISLPVLENRGVNAFAFDYPSIDRPRRTLEDDTFQELLLALWQHSAEKSRDVAYIAEGETGCVFTHSGDPRQGIRTLDGLIALTDYLVQEYGTGRDALLVLKRFLPRKLRHLAPLIERWGIIDDGRREYLLESASHEELKSLIEPVLAVEPEILSFINNSSPQDEIHGCVIFRTEALFQAATEARTRLRRED